MTPFLFLVRIFLGLLAFAGFCVVLAVIQYAIERNVSHPRPSWPSRPFSWRLRSRIFWWLRGRKLSLTRAWSLSGLKR